MKKAFGIVLFIILFAVVSACSNKEPSDKKATAPVSGQESKGGNTSAVSGYDVFKTSCISCHSSGDISGGQIKIDGAKIHSDFKTSEDLLAFISKNMPKSAPGSLSKNEYDALEKYLWEQK